MLHAEAFLSSTRIACGFFSMRKTGVSGNAIHLLQKQNYAEISSERTETESGMLHISHLLAAIHYA